MIDRPAARVLQNVCETSSTGSINKNLSGCNRSQQGHTSKTRKRISFCYMCWQAVKKDLEMRDKLLTTFISNGAAYCVIMCFDLWTFQTSDGIITMRKSHI